MSKRGFAALSPERVREISRLGGKAAHARGTAHKWTSETASSAGKKGGLAPHASRGRSRPDDSQTTLPAAEDVYVDDPPTMRAPPVYPDGEAA